MKAHLKFALRLAGTLTAIAVVVAGLLGLVNNVTEDKIDEANRVKTENAMMEVVKKWRLQRRLLVPRLWHSLRSPMVMLPQAMR